MPFFYLPDKLRFCTLKQVIAAKLARKLRNMKLSNSFSGALRTFAYFMASGTQNTLKGINYLELYGEEPSAIEQVFAIYANVIELDESGDVLNAKFAEKRATDYLRAYCDPTFRVSPPYEEWETELYNPPPLKDKINQITQK